MTEQWSVPAWGVLAAAGVLLLLTVLLLASAAGRRRAAARHAREAHEARAETARLRAEVAALEKRLTDLPRHQPATGGHVARVGEQPEYVITGVPTDAGPRAEPVPAVEARLFADLVARETVIQAASLLHGLRRALSAESRNRIRFEMRREVKRARKQRRTDLRAARRAWEARQREELSA